MSKDPFKDIILKALRKARRPISTSKVATKTRMDWTTARDRLKSLQSAGKIHTKKTASKRLWSTRKIK